MRDRHSSSTDGSAEGFSLLEVLVATALMGLVLVVLLQVLTSTIRVQESDWTHTRALMVAEKVLQENCGLNKLTEGTYQGREGRFDYRVHIVPQYQISSEMDTAHFICSTIQVTVFWKERGVDKSLALTTVRTGPAEKS
ncbi:MAG: prepilin-type N-terminal cleavage/methylation domain-containing protein [Thermodesulfobacteriota bacterium]